MREQANLAIAMADVILFLTDIKQGVTAADREISIMLKKSGKPIVLVCNKADNFQKDKEEAYEFYNLGMGDPYPISATNALGIGDVLDKIYESFPENVEENKDENIIKVAVIGIPNVGKSSFINRISKRTTAGVGNKPGVTKQKQWIRINDKIELLDTPGVLWPKFESQEVALNLAFTGTIKEDILQRTEIAYELIKFLLKNYKKKICQRYGITEEYIDNTLNKEQPENFNIYEIMLEIGRKRGCIISGGNIDEEKTARIILDEFKNGKLGKITLESPKK